MSDASGSWGCGAYWDEKWFNLQWPAQFLSLNIATKELIPVVIAAVLFGSQWQGQLIQFTVDNMAVVHVLNATYSKDPHLMHLIHNLVFIAASGNFRDISVRSSLDSNLKWFPRPSHRSNASPTPSP